MTLLELVVLVRHQFVVGAAGRAALGLALVQPEPDHGRVVFLTCTEGGRGGVSTAGMTREG